MLKALTLYLLPLLLLLVACGPSDSGDSAEAEGPTEENRIVQDLEIDPEALRAEDEAWHKDRIEGLKRAESWLSLVGLDWLEEGENLVGSNQDHPVVLPQGLPTTVGHITLTDGVATFETAPGVDLTIDGDASQTRAQLVSDMEGQPTEMRIGSVLFYLIQRGDRYGVRIKDSQAATLRDFTGIDTFPIDPAYAVTAFLEKHDPPRTLPVPNVLGEIENTPSPGTLHFTLDGQELSLDTLDGGDGTFWLLFADTTNGQETYGAGRFLYTSAPDAEGRILVDFNRAYNPPCIFTPYATCPLPPPQNRLPVAVRAGEKNYGEHH